MLYPRRGVWQKVPMGAIGERLLPSGARAWARRCAAMLVAATGVVVSASAAVAASDADFAAWLREFKIEARQHGISQHTLTAALDHVTPLPHVIELDRKQPEFTLTFEEYVARVVSDARVEQGRTLKTQYQAILARVAASYGVAPRFIVALWGIESDYGHITGDYPVIQTVATLAYDGRRADYFRGELIAALRILDLGYIDLSGMRGSWAGAMGQPQFMPSSYLRYAVDYEKKGRRDIWHDPADIFASTANYLAKLGWESDDSWGEEVTLPPNFDTSVADLEIVKGSDEWQALGVRAASGRPLSPPLRPASLILPADEGGPAFLVYDNFRTLLRWNHSTFFATSVGLLADRIGGQ